MQQSKHYVCPMEATTDIIGGKWKGVILYYLLLKGSLRFGELRQLLPTVTQRMLTLQLRELERDGIIAREVYKQVPPKTEYYLTAFGRGLEPVIHTMTEWGRQYVRMVEDEE